MIKILEFKVSSDDRGSLVALENSIDIPFDIKRVYYLFKNNNKTVRGQHAHKNLKQVYVAVSGSCKVRITNENKSEVVTLDKPTIGILFDQIIWRELFDFSADCVLMVLADDLYKEEDYIRNYEEFLEYKKLNKN